MQQVTGETNVSQRPFVPLDIVSYIIYKATFRLGGKAGDSA